MNIQRILPAIAIVAVIGFAISSTRAESGAKEAIAAGALLIDVRTPAEFAEAHLKDAINIPVDVLASRLSEVGSKDQNIVVYCRSGKRSAHAKSVLTGAGFKRVLDLGAMSNGQ